MAKAEAGRQRLRRHDPLTAQKQLIREGAQRQPQGRRGRGEQGWTMERAAEGAGEIPVRRGLGSHSVHGAPDPRLGDGMQDQAHAIVVRDPGHPLTPGTHGAAEAELERGQKARQHAAPGAEDQADAQGDHADTHGLDRRGGVLPRVAQTVTEAGVGGAGFIEDFVGVQAVPADGRAADQDLGPALQPGDQTAEVAGDFQARAQDAAALGEGPQAVADGLAGEIDHRVNARVVSDLVQVSDDGDGGGEVGGLRIADQGDDLVTGAGQGLDQPTADEAGCAGDEDASAARKLTPHQGGVGLDQTVGAFAGGQVAQTEDEDAGGRGAGHQTPQAMRGRGEGRRLIAPRQQKGRKQDEDGAVVQGQQGMGDALRSRQTAGAVLLDEVGQGDDHLDGQQNHDGDGEQAFRLGPRDHQEEGRVDEVADAVQTKLGLLRRPPRQPLGQFMVEQGVEGAHGDLERQQDPEQVGHVSRPGTPHPGREAGRAAGDRGPG
nr:hypothetical protein [Brevundimonas lenta]